jgi:hypothetical protein
MVMILPDRRASRRARRFVDVMAAKIIIIQLAEALREQRPAGSAGPDMVWILSAIGSIG